MEGWIDVRRGCVPAVTARHDDGDDLFSHQPLQLVPVILVTYFSSTTLTSTPAPFTLTLPTLLLISLTISTSCHSPHDCFVAQKCCASVITPRDPGHSDCSNAEQTEIIIY